MKKLFALLLALCCMWTAAGAILGAQLYGTSRYTYEVPADWMSTAEEVWSDDAAEYTSVRWMTSGQAVTIEPEGAEPFTWMMDTLRISLDYCKQGKWLEGETGYASLEEAWEKTVTGTFQEVSALELNGRSVLCGATPDRAVLLWIDGPLMLRMDASCMTRGEWNRAAFESYFTTNIVLPMLNTLHNSYGRYVARMVAPVEAAEGKQVVRLANAIFQLDEDLVCSEADDARFVAENERYSVSVLCLDWYAEDVDVSMTDDIQRDNAYWCLYRQTGDRDVAQSNAEQFQHRDCSMPNGADVMLWETEEQTVLTHYYRGTGFMMTFAPKAEDEPALTEAALEAAKNFRLEDVSEVDMQADADAIAAAKAKAAAEAEAAAKAAAEAEAAAKAAAEAEAAALAALKKYVVITAESGRIRTVASISGGLIRKAYEGETFELIREERDWYIIDVDGRKGYIHKGVSAIKEN